MTAGTKHLKEKSLQAFVLLGKGHAYLPAVDPGRWVQLLHVHQHMERAARKTTLLQTQLSLAGHSDGGYGSPGPAPNSEAVEQCQRVSWHRAVPLQHLSAEAVPCHPDWLMSGCPASGILLLNKNHNFSFSKAHG